MHQQSLSNLTKKQKGSNKSIKFDCQFDQLKQAAPEFAEAAILNRYHQLQKIHFQQLATINMSDVLKRKLFGFSSVSYLVNEQNPDQLILQNHPLKGRTIMKKARFQQKEFQSDRSANLHSFSCSENTNFMKHNNLLKTNEFNNNIQHSRQLLLDEGNGATDQKIENTDNRLLGEINI